MASGTPGPLLDLVCLNAGAAFYCAGRADSLQAGFALSRRLFADGQVQNTFERYRELAGGAADQPR